MALDPKRVQRILIAATATLAALALAACGTDDTPESGNASAPDYSKALESAPPELADLYRPGGVLLDGGLDAYERQLASLEGVPVVANKWASWCGPCRAEFPHFQQQAAEHANEVAFLGVNSDDNDAAARTFLRDNPIPYPSFSDPDKVIAQEMDAALEFPATTFYDRDGKIVHVQRGVYADEADLAADVQKYALSG